MLRVTTHTARWAIVLTIPALYACADETPVPTAPHPHPSLTANVVPQDTFVVTNRSGGTATGTLRWAVSQAHMGDIIRFASTLAGDTVVIDTTVTLPSFMTIEGPRDKGITISGGRRVLVMRVTHGATLRNVGIKDGNGPSVGGIQSTGALRLENSVVWMNNAPATAGIFGDTITLVNSTVMLNAGPAGGAGGISYARHGTLTLINSTIAFNAPSRGLAPWGNATDIPKVTLVNSILSRNGNGISHWNCYDTIGFTYVGMNLADDTSCGFTTGMVVLDPRLGLPGNYGGPTATIQLDRQSAAINAGGSCSVAVDQRYVARDTYCDVGAFEFTDFTVVTMTVDPNVTVNTTSGVAVVTGTVRCSRAGDTLGLRVALTQQKGGKTPSTVQGAGTVGVTCATSARAWSAVVSPSSGTFDTGSAVAAAATNDTPVWIRSASVSTSVKVVRARK